MEFLNEIWLKVRYHELKKNILFKKGGQNKFCDIFRNDSNLC